MIKYFILLAYLIIFIPIQQAEASQLMTAKEAQILIQEIGAEEVAKQFGQSEKLMGLFAKKLSQADLKWFEVYKALGKARQHILQGRVFVNAINDALSVNPEAVFRLKE